MPTVLMQIRSVDTRAADKIKAAAALRKITLGDMLARLISLHEIARARADAGDDSMLAELEALGLETVTRSA